EQLDVDRLMQDLASATTEGDWTLSIVARPKRTVAAAVPAPPLGWAAVRPVRVQGSDPWTGPDMTVTTRIVRGKDVGDSYNYAPPEDDVLVDGPVEERRERLEDGPLRRVEVLQ